MNNFSLYFLNYLLNSIWQIPLVFLAAALAARLTRPIGSRAQHKIWVAALFAELILPLCQFDAIARWHQLAAFTLRLLQWNTRPILANGQVHVEISSITPRSLSWLHLPAAAQSPVVIAYCAACLYFTLRLAVGVWKTHHLTRTSRPVHSNNEIQASLSRIARAAHIAPKIAISSTITSPVTLGFFRPSLLLPANFLDRIPPAELDAVVAHELAHIRRHDFAKNLLYGLLSIPIAYHRILWLTCARIAESREMICDELAAETLSNHSHNQSLNQTLTSRESYARSLLHLASLLTVQTKPNPLHAIGIFDANIPNIFERRIMNLTRKSSPATRPRKFAIALTGSILAVVTCASTMAIHINAATPAAQPVAPSDETKPLPRDLKDLKLVKKVNPTYPVEAKTNKNSIDGTVTLEAIIGKDGAIENLKVLKSLRNDYDRSALDAVRQWIYEPYLLNGDPVEVETTINVTFALAK